MNTPPAPELPHTAKRNPLTGALVIHFTCPLCKSALHAPFSDAGKSDNCPECQGLFRTPGMNARREEDKRLAEKAEARSKAASEAAAQQQAAATKRQEAEVEAASKKAEAMTAGFALDQQRRMRIPRTRDIGRLAVFSVCLGLALILIGIAIDTSVPSSEFSRVHNVGLLNDRLILIMCGTILLVGGFVLRGIAALGSEVNRWGVAMQPTTPDKAG